MTNLQTPWIGYPEDEEGTEEMYCCEWCRCAIYEGDTYYDINGTRICEDCIDECKKTA